MPGTFKTLNEDDLENVLRQVFKQLKEKRLLPADANEDELVQGVKDKIKQGDINLDLTAKDNSSFIKTLSAALVGEHINKTYGTQLNFVNLFKDMPSLSAAEQKQLKDELKELFKAKLDHLEKISPEPKPWMKNKDQLAEILAEKLMQQADKENPLFKDDKTMSLVMDLTISALNEKEDMSLRSKFGGIRPDQAGGVRMTVQEMDYGNVAGFVKQDQSLPTDKSMMADLGQYNPDKPDYVGLEKVAEIAAEALAPIIEPVTHSLESSHTLAQDPYAPKFTPDG